MNTQENTTIIFVQAPIDLIENKKNGIKPGAIYQAINFKKIEGMHEAIFQIYTDVIYLSCCIFKNCAHIDYLHWEIVNIKKI